MLQLPTHVTCFTEAVDAVRHCDRLATLVSVQAHSIKNTRQLIVALIQHTFTQLLPMPKPEASVGLETIHEDATGPTPPHAIGPARADRMGPADGCLWRTPMLYADQLDLLLLMQRLVEHFAAAVFSLDHTRSLDGVRMAVPACIAAIADCVMRQVRPIPPCAPSSRLLWPSLTFADLR